MCKCMGQCWFSHTIPPTDSWCSVIYSHREVVATKNWLDLVSLYTATNIIDHIIIGLVIYAF